MSAALCSFVYNRPSRQSRNNEIWKTPNFVYALAAWHICQLPHHSQPEMLMRELNFSLPISISISISISTVLSYCFMCFIFVAATRAGNSRNAASMPACLAATRGPLWTGSCLEQVGQFHNKLSNEQQIKIENLPLPFFRPDHTTINHINLQLPTIP